ncbi:amidohydrolase family protein [uncultured Paracoccus sp.]|uniref:amidohydrolase family protein n=1 Tax=uncultured Paracoccus sp. TaxID=189685 RepID=UPI002616966F|nr:amidohydrolase family protein [uncultured Paracoccus sp.]
MIDAHQHFWQLGRGDYAWPNADVEPIFRDFGPSDLAPLIEAAGIDQTVLVQATPTVAETEFLLQIAARTPFVAGVVGWVELTAPDAVATIERLQADPALKGLRPMLQGIEDTDWILQAAAEPALRHMAATGLCFDALVQPRHLEAIARIATRHPDLRIVIDHMAKPHMGGGRAPEAVWLNGMDALAALPNVWCKLSGMITEIGPDWTMAGLTAHAAHVLDRFGAGRVMWGSDWPVVNLAGDYAGWYQAALDLTAGLSSEDRERVFDGTARAFYGLT